MLRAVSNLDEVSFHMSGTEAVMAAAAGALQYPEEAHRVLRRAYHGWWDGVQTGLAASGASTAA